MTLKSGRKSSWYVSWRNIAADVYLLDQLADFLISCVTGKNLKVDVFYGVPEGATKLGVIATYKWVRAQPSLGPGSHALAMGRAKPKEHGAPADRFFVGEPRGKVIVVEDVTTTGGSLLETLDHLSAINADIVAAVGLTNRGERRSDGRRVAEVIAERGVPYYAMSEAAAFLPEAVKRFKPSPEIIRDMEKEFQELK